MKQQTKLHAIQDTQTTFTNTHHFNTCKFTSNTFEIRNTAYSEITIRNLKLF